MVGDLHVKNFQKLDKSPQKLNNVIGEEKSKSGIKAKENQINSKNKVKQNETIEISNDHTTTNLNTNFNQNKDANALNFPIEKKIGKIKINFKNSLVEQQNDRSKNNSNNDNININTASSISSTNISSNNFNNTNDLRRRKSSILKLFSTKNDNEDGYASDSTLSSVESIPSRTMSPKLKEAEDNTLFEDNEDLSSVCSTPVEQSSPQSVRKRELRSRTTSNNHLFTPISKDEKSIKNKKDRDGKSENSAKRKNKNRGMTTKLGGKGDDEEVTSGGKSSFTKVHVPAGLVNPFDLMESRNREKSRYHTGKVIYKIEAQSVENFRRILETEISSDLDLIRNGLVEFGSNYTNGINTRSNTTNKNTALSDTPGSPLKIEDIKKNMANDDFCSACLQKGKLICCDSCPRTFHICCLEEGYDIPSSGLWFCRECSNRGQKKVKVNNIFFDPLLNHMRGMNPRVFELSQDIREMYENVWTHPGTGDFIDVNNCEVVNINNKTRSVKNNIGVIENFPIKIKEKFKCCYSCGKSDIKQCQNSLLNSFSVGFDLSKKSKDVIPRAERSEMIKCDYCNLHWHLDCLDPPLPNIPWEFKEEKEIVDTNFIKKLRKRAWGEVDEEEDELKKAKKFAPESLNSYFVGLIQIRKKWMCPLHVENILNISKRIKRSTKVVDAPINSNSKSNTSSPSISKKHLITSKIGEIGNLKKRKFLDFENSKQQKINDQVEARIGNFEEKIINEVTYKLPEYKVKLDFFSKVDEKKKKKQNIIKEDLSFPIGLGLEYTNKLKELYYDNDNGGINFDNNKNEEKMNKNLLLVASEIIEKEQSNLNKFNAKFNNFNVNNINGNNNSNSNLNIFENGLRCTDEEADLWLESVSQMQMDIANRIIEQINKKNIAKGLVNEMENEKKVMHNSDEENDEILKGIEKIRNDNEEEKKNKTIVESNLEEKTNNNDDTSSTLKKKKKKIKNELPEDSVWQKLQDPNTSKYYYFNSITQETTWISPMDPDFIEKKKKEKMDNLQQNQKLQQQQQWGGYTDLSQQQPYFGNDITYQYNNGEAPPGLENEVSNQQNTQQQPTYEDYTVTGAFNTSTGRFQVNDVRGNIF
ncbi:hypothetical protein HK099_007400 [Clydaea vesicula]|uniref:Uncharacterized protein n=1 Tax=Clydaea vesicula TaxID=447962 RepID=A0AAD5TWW5_9FUNG|nr:hypothetical protein HK099_007400 [Clydaea vesicula]